MKKEFIPYTEALQMKKLGFNEACLAYYNPKTYEFLIGTFDPVVLELFLYRVLIPLYQQAFRWFREKYNLFAMFVPIRIETGGKEGYRYRWAIHDIIGNNDDIDTSALGFYSPEEAQLACLQQLIKIVQESK